MEIKKAIRIIDSSLDAMDFGKQLREAWESIRAKIVEVKKPSTNKHMDKIKSICLECRKEYPMCKVRRRCHVIQCDDFLPCNK